MFLINGQNSNEWMKERMKEKAVLRIPKVKCYKCGNDVDWGGYGEPNALVNVCLKCHTENINKNKAVKK